MRVGAGIVLGTAVGLGAAALWAEPMKVTMAPAFGAKGHYRMCSSMYNRSTVYIGGAENDGDSQVSIVSIKPTGTTGVLHVEGFVFQPAPMTPSNGAASLPKLAHPHIIRAHESGELSVLITGRDGGGADAFEVTVQRGGARYTQDLDFAFDFDRSPCPES